MRNHVHGLVWFSMAATLIFSTGCTIGSQGKIPDPRFTRYSRQHNFPVRTVTHRVGDLDLTVISGSLTEVYTVVGTVDWTAYIDTKVVNRGSRPLRIEASSLECIRASGSKTAAYSRPADLQPGGQADLRLGVPAGLSRYDKPVALVYQGVRMDL